MFKPISILKIPKIPKIILRKPGNEPKHVKTSRERKGLIISWPGHDNAIMVSETWLSNSLQELTVAINFETLNHYVYDVFWTEITQRMLPATNLHRSIKFIRSVYEAISYQKSKSAKILKKVANPQFWNQDFSAKK